MRASSVVLECESEGPKSSCAGGGSRLDTGLPGWRPPPPASLAFHAPAAIAARECRRMAFAREKTAVHGPFPELEDELIAPHGGFWRRA
jgi:hypothetical protein